MTRYDKIYVPVEKDRVTIKGSLAVCKWRRLKSVEGQFWEPQSEVQEHKDVIVLTVEELREVWEAARELQLEVCNNPGPGKLNSPSLKTYLQSKGTMTPLIKYILISTVVFCSVSAKSQSRYPWNNYDNRLTSLGNVWIYVEEVDKALDAANKRIDSLTHELKLQRELLQFNTTMGNRYIEKVDSFRQHGVGIYPSYKIKDTLALGPFYIY